MSNSEAPFLMLDQAAIEAAELRRTPYDYAFVDQCMPEELKDRVLADVPVIPHRGSYGIPSLKYGPEFEKVIKDLLSDRFRHVVEKKFGMDLSKTHPCIVMMGNTSGVYNEGYSHPDSKHKIVTVLVGFSKEWPYEKGQLRVLNSLDREDVAFEYPPVFGKMLMFRVCDHSYHGFLPQKGQRVSLQLCYVDSKWYVQKEYWRHAISAFCKANPIMLQLINWFPRKLRK